MPKPQTEEALTAVRDAIREGMKHLVGGFHTFDEVAEESRKALESLLQPGGELVHIQEQLALPGMEEEAVAYISPGVAMKYIFAEFLLDFRGDGVEVQVEPDAPEEVMLEQMERRMKGDRAWTQIPLFQE